MMRRRNPNRRERVILQALAHLESTDPRSAGAAGGYGTHMLRQVSKVGILRGDLTRLCTWELMERIGPGLGWRLTWEGWVWLAEVKVWARRIGLSKWLEGRGDERRG